MLSIDLEKKQFNVIDKSFKINDMKIFKVVKKWESEGIRIDEIRFGIDLGN